MTETTPAATPEDPAPAGTAVETPTDAAVVTPVEPTPEASPAPETTVSLADTPSDTPAAPITTSAQAAADPSVPSVPGPNDPAPEAPAQIITPTGPDTTDQHTDTAIKAANGGSTDTATSNEDDQPEAYVPPPAGPGAPDAPTITSPEAGDVSGTVVITGTATNGNLVYLEEGEGQFPVAPATAQDGAFRFVISLEPGEHSLSVRQRSAAGDTSDPSDTLVVNVVPVPEEPSADDPDARFAHFLRHSLLDGSVRLSWDLYANLRQYAEEWLNAKDSTQSAPPAAADTVEAPVGTQHSEQSPSTTA